METQIQTGTQVRVSALASGSSGNAFLVEVAGTRLLFDAGLNAATLDYYMRQRGVLPSQLAAIFISHEHIDHLRGVGILARRYRLPVVASEGTFLAGAYQFGHLPEKVVQLPGREVHISGVDGTGDVAVRTFVVSHDAAEPTGFWIEAGGRNIVICTDLGCETASIREPLEAADLLVLEANHDVDRLWRGRYPPALKRRVAGRYGHLANADAARLVSELARDGRPRTVWLAHLSAANNTPALAFDAVTEPLKCEGCTHLEIAVLARDRPSHTWRSGIGADKGEARAEGAEAIRRQIAPEERLYNQASFA
ncbi:MAG TPA: MBL fold metallo-hydrolase [Chloroflexia bacterium]|nr:MBL fold metallo-hydrolase [Chloroflexia bacterium]